MIVRTINPCTCRAPCSINNRECHLAQVLCLGGVFKDSCFQVRVVGALINCLFLSQFSRAVMDTSCIIWYHIGFWVWILCIVNHFLQPLCSIVRESWLCAMLHCHWHNTQPSQIQDGNVEVATLPKWWVSTPSLISCTTVPFWSIWHVTCHRPHSVTVSDRATCDNLWQCQGQKIL